MSQEIFVQLAARYDGIRRQLHPGFWATVSTARLMFTARPEQNRDEESDDRAEANPPRPFNRRKPGWLYVGDAAENSSNSVEQVADDRNEDNQNREPNRSPADSVQALFTRGGAIDVGLVPVASKACGQCVERGAERPHCSGKNSGNQKSPHADRHLV